MFNETPFHLFISGATGTGKTHDMLEIIEEDFFRSLPIFFSYAQPSSTNTTYHKLKYINDPKVVVFDKDDDKKISHP